jgi:hypothetical protein
MKVGDIKAGGTFYAPDLETKVKKVWIVDERDGKTVRATRRDGRFHTFKADEEVEPGPRVHGKNNK